MSVAGQRARALQLPETKTAYITKYDSILGNSPFTKNPSSIHPIESSSGKANVALWVLRISAMGLDCEDVGSVVCCC